MVCSAHTISIVKSKISLAGKKMRSLLTHSYSHLVIYLCSVCKLHHRKLWPDMQTLGHGVWRGASHPGRSQERSLRHSIQQSLWVRRHSSFPSSLLTREFIYSSLPPSIGVGKEEDRAWNSIESLTTTCALKAFEIPPSMFKGAWDRYYCAPVNYTKFKSPSQDQIVVKRRESKSVAQAGLTVPSGVPWQAVPADVYSTGLMLQEKETHISNVLHFV